MIVKKSIYDITTFGEILIDFTSQDINEDGQMLYARNPGGAPANVAVAASRLGAHTAFIGKAGKDMHGEFLRNVLAKENVETRGMHLDELTQENLKEFARFGNAVASLCVEKKGAIPAMPELAWVEERMGMSRCY